MNNIILEDEKKFRAIESAHAAFTKCRIDPGSMFELVEDWESRSTISSKRSLTALALVLSSVYFVGLDYSYVKLPWLEGFDQAQSQALSFVLGFLLVVYGLAYCSNVVADLRLRSDRINVLSDAVGAAQVQRDILVHHLGEGFAGKVVKLRKPETGKIDAQLEIGPLRPNFYLISLYEQRIQKTNSFRWVLKILEWCFIAILFSVAITDLLAFWCKI